ncbi:LPS export ABC transporter periplasmic protein LptC [Adhaeribacter aquaticus]|uniref:LPS export ABC transporter periplasmic protein LptC n=1 Tax=Adhaeribacter aquaticus TaxID=299567 RepID=UPI0003F9436E|nr:LPS export ABC transporter periplasmic protein LptC [Adhaeribacter aquaticus]
MRRTIQFGLLICLFVNLVCCNPSIKDPKKKVVYNGPIAQAKDVFTLYSDSAKLQIKLSAPLQLQFENGNGTYPKGIDMVFYDRQGKITNTLKANYGEYEKQTDTYLVRGNVILANAVKQETMKTEELHWDRQKRQLYTDKFVSIQTETEILTGTGLTASQDFSRYKILQPKGIFSIQ